MRLADCDGASGNPITPSQNILAITPSNQSPPSQHILAINHPSNQAPPAKALLATNHPQLWLPITPSQTIFTINTTSQAFWLPIAPRQAFLATNNPSENILAINYSQPTLFGYKSPLAKIRLQVAPSQNCFSTHHALAAQGPANSSKIHHRQ